MAALAAAAAVVSQEADAEFQIYAVDGYYFESSRKEPVCFSTLPLRFGDAAAAVPEGNKRLFLRGFAGRRPRVCKRVVAWRLELDGEQPEFFVLLSADSGGWLRLAKARKLYERTARTVLMTAQALHFLRRNPDGPETALWIHLRQAFGRFWPRPSEHDFRNQTSLSLMTQFAATDPVLANSETLRAFVERISTKVGGADIIDIADEYFFHAKDNYKFVCFSTLPLRFRAAAAADVPEGNRALYLVGCTDGGLRLHKEVVAWRLELDGEQPRFLVLAPADGGGWLRLAKARNIYERTARTVLMTAQMLHFLRRNPDGPETALWIHLRQVFGNFRPSPSEDDLWNQTSLSLMRQFAATDPVLADSEALRAFIERISTTVGGADIIGIADEYSFRAKDNYELVCFSSLPLRFGAAAADVPEGNKALYLSGFTAGGLKLLKQVVAWRLELDGEQPRFLVLTPAYGGGWLCLANAWNMYKRTAKTVLMTAQMLHFLRRNPDGPEIALWIHLHQVFGKFWSMPSEDDFRNQTSLSLMRQFASMDPVLANSEALRAFVERISTETLLTSLTTVRS
ncbi:uncharacterized protein [Miscanthus floridulus]|uniref:uncharacterized protein isoform X3 n=1 Tax=Miscanthus floridulus TaxID=154761 RepID=UPI003457B5AC